MLAKGSLPRSFDVAYGLLLSLPLRWASTDVALSRAALSSRGSPGHCSWGMHRLRHGEERGKAAGANPARRGYWWFPLRHGQFGGRRRYARSCANTAAGGKESLVDGSG